MESMEHRTIKQSCLPPFPQPLETAKELEGVNTVACEFCSCSIRVEIIRKFPLA
jgi:hypothetical protein